MPVYGYRCSRGHHFEVPQRITDAPLAVCPECGVPVTRVFYPVGIIFKGGGFYKTDSRGSSASDGSTPSAEPAKADAAKIETRTETKAPAKTEEKSTKKDGAE